ncbi:SHOCT domain-containing protein [Cryobacterium sp. TmT2-59]|uniref:SHOCT domain-containing protein n=1 Tax=Cryobacterium shii TaxID=1259235 RepID=A0AAQ2HG64_9MICO|nr:MULTISPECIES: SHOCT domain-containing protein [Cryobacterium]TFC48873.1 SHOCT domain-containing protein [Cryobacterium shii]TFC86081.1 SHOCT domain-containing protein [Cryobacterium sp. TmT2-59]
MMWGYDGGMGWAWFFGLLVIIGIALLIVLAVRLSAGPAAGPSAGPPAGPARENGTPGRSRARQILDERFAKGELTVEQYREQIRALGEGGE